MVEAAVLGLAAALLFVFAAFTWIVVKFARDLMGFALDILALVPRPRPQQPPRTEAPNLADLIKVAPDLASSLSRRAAMADKARTMEDLRDQLGEMYMRPGRVRSAISFGGPPDVPPAPMPSTIPTGEQVNT